MKKTLSILAAVFTLLVAGTLPAQAGLVTPAGLNPGDQFRIIFVSSVGRGAGSNNLADYDTFITDLAVAAGLDTYFGASVTWQVLGSTETVSAIDRLPASSPALYRIDGAKVADSGSDLWDASIDAAINVNELGTGGIAQRVATGTLSNGSVASGSGFGDPLGSSMVETGNSASTDQTWVDEGVGGTPGNWRFYGYSSVLTVPTVTPVPEPGSLTLLGLGVVVLFISNRRRLKWVTVNRG